MLLTLGECRLFLASKCLNSYPDIKSMVTGWLVREECKQTLPLDLP